MLKVGELSNLRVLLVDDQEEIHHDFVEMLQDDRAMASDQAAPDFGPTRTAFELPTFDLQHANSGEEAIVKVDQARRSGRRLAVAYVDIRMPPGIDGVETVRRIRRIDREVEIVIMTAYTDKSLPEIIGGMELLHKLLYIRKPFAREEIQQITLSLAVKWNVEQALVDSRRRLKESHRRLEAVLDATEDGIAMYEDARLVFANRSYDRLFDIPPGELHELSRDAAMTRFKEALPPLLPAGKAQAPPGRRRESMVECLGAPSAAGQARLFHRSWWPVREGDGHVIGDLVVFRDASRTIEVDRMKLEVERLQGELEDGYSLGGIVGLSAAMRQVSALIRQVANSDVSVLVQGESGTGKELVAKALHFNGRRRKGPFVAVNLAALPETLIESELFGHERGAFTGALSRRTGYFEQAHGGTLLLDEIGEMPSAVQAKLLRVLQEGRIRRLGGTTDIPIDVRVIAATNRDLEAAAGDGAFREDLYYRIAVFPIVVPPLRTRPEDIPVLAAHFLKKHAARVGRTLQGISATATLLLTRYRWPGNVRELENVICRAMVLETTGVLQAGNLPPELSLPGTSGSPITALAEIERQWIAHALEVSGHNVTKAAQALGIDRTTLYRKLKKSGRRAR